MSNTVTLVQHGYRYIHTRVTKQRVSVPTVSVVCLQRDLFNQRVTAPPQLQQYLGCVLPDMT